MLSLAALIVSLPTERAGADFAFSHTGSTDPTTEGFSQHQINSASTFGPIANDLGRAAWSIAGTGTSSQGWYQTGAFSAGQLADIAAQGFVLTFEARVVQGLAQAYDSVEHVTIGGAVVELSRRYDVFLGLDSNGDTVVVLPTSVSITTGGQISMPGPSYTLTGSGSSYHNYQLVYDPGTELADLYVDGILRLEDYAGHSSFVHNRGLLWGAHSGGQANFSFVELASIPEPSAFLYLGLLALLGTVCHFAVAHRIKAQLVEEPTP
jgi:hypothetical protein